MSKASKLKRALKRQSTKDDGVQTVEYPTGPMQMLIDNPDNSIFKGGVFYRGIPTAEGTIAPMSEPTLMEKIADADLSSEPDVKDKEWASDPSLQAFTDYKQGKTPSELADEFTNQGKENPLEGWRGSPYLPEDEMTEEVNGQEPPRPLTEEEKKNNFQKALHDMLSGMPNREGNGYGSAIFDSEMAARGIAQPSLTALVKQTSNGDKLRNLLVSGKMNQAAANSKYKKLADIQKLKNQYKLDKAKVDAYGKTKMKDKELAAKIAIARMNNIARIASSQARAGGDMMATGILQNDYPDMVQGVLDKVLKLTPQQILDNIRMYPELAEQATPEQKRKLEKILGR